MGYMKRLNVVNMEVNQKIVEWPSSINCKVNHVTC